MAQRTSNISLAGSLSNEAKNERILRLSAVIAVAWLPALFGHDAVQSAAARFALANSANPYFVPDQAWILYIWTPLVVASACLLFLSPGLFLSLALNAATGVGRWVLTGFALSLVILSVAAAAVQWIVGSPLLGSAFAVVVVVCSLACFGFLLIRTEQGRVQAWPISKPYAKATLIPMIVVPLLLLITLAPKFYWENLNGDGAGAFETERLLLAQSLPFWPDSAGDMASFPGITTMLFAYPGSWFVRLFGEVEASARLPYLLYLVPLFGVILALVETLRTRPLGIPERWLIWLSLSVYTIAMAYSATYNQYAADIADPATEDTLLIIFFLAFILAFLERNWKWMYLFILLTFLSRPSALQLIGFWLLAMLILWKPRPWREAAQVASGLVACLMISIAFPLILSFLHLPLPGNEHNPVELLKHFAWLQFTDLHRIAYAVVPGGILPAVALLLWRGQNQVAKALTLVTVAYFLFFYVSAHIILHYFVPAMLIPVVIFWQSDLVADPRRRTLVLSSVALAGFIALVISLPKNATPDTSARLIGSAIEDRVGGYDAHDPAALKRVELIYHLFPVDWDPRVPDQSYGGSSVAWAYYINHHQGNTTTINYVLQRATDPAPQGMRFIAEDGDAALYLRSDAVWATHIALRPPTPAGSPVYEIPRGIIFRSVPLKDGPPILDMVNTIEGFGFNMTPILDRLGVKRQHE
jgi:hypothetical protein